MFENLTTERAIESYQPAWLPPRGELQDVIVVINPVGGGAKSAEQRHRDDLALMTGGHLFHLIQAAGGVPVMTRADDRPIPGADAGPDAALGTICAQRNGDLIVSVEFMSRDPARATHRGRVGVLPYVDNALSRSLARCVADAAGIAAQPVDVAARRSAGFDLGVPGVKVRLQGPDEEASQLDRQTFHRGCAEQMYTGLASFVRAEHDSLDAARARRPPELSATTVGPVPRFSNRTPEQELVETARCIWPHGKLPIERAPWYCEMFEQVALSDRTVVHLKLRVTVEGDRVVVDGATNVACLRDTLADALRAVGVERVRNEMRLLPEEGRLGERRFGVCVVSMALTHAEPCETADLRTQLLYGEPLLLLDHDSGHYLLHGGDGYWGWVREECVRVLTGGEFKRYSVAKRAVLLRDVDLSDRRVVRGAILPVASSRGNTMALMQPDGTRLDVAAEDIRVVEASKLSGDRVRRALSLLHRPYVFGAVSPMGLDCSGLVRNVCEQTGSTVARDAAQQFLQGRLVATRWYRDDIRPGDLLFFVNPTGKVFHVGIAISATHFVHCAPPEVKINSLRKGDRLYCEYRDRTFLAARRL